MNSDTDTNFKTFQKLLRTTLVVASVESVTYSLMQLRGNLWLWKPFCFVVMMTGIGVLALLLPIHTLRIGLIAILASRRVRHFFYTLALIALQIGVAVVGIRQVNELLA